MKSTYRQLRALAATGGFFLSLSMISSAVETEEGDLLIGFYEVDSLNTVGPDTYVVNLGPAALYRENTVGNVPVSSIPGTPMTNANIGADLVTAFGEDWAERGSVRWCIVGGLSQSYTGPDNGDSTRTSYMGLPVSQFVASGPGSVAPAVSASPRGTLSNQIRAFRSAQHNAGTPGVNARGAIVPTSVPSSLEEYLPPATAAQFGLGMEFRGTFDEGKLQGSNTLEGALDVWRLLNNTTGTDLTSGMSTGNAVLGTGQYIATFTIDADGNLRIGGPMTGGSTGNFASFAQDNGLTGGATGDTDQDGVSNLLEYALNTNLTGPDTNLGSFNGTTLTFNKRPAAVANGDLTYTIQESDDLGVTDAWQAVSGVTNSSSVISYTLPTGKNKIFYRLHVSAAP